MDIAKLRNVGFHYNNHQALKDITLTIKKGEVLYLIGENGAGKSTLLLILAALYVPTSGIAKIYGKIITEKSTKDIELRRKIGIVFQDPDVQLFSPTVYDDVSFAPKHLQDYQNYKKKVELAMRRMNVWDLKDRHPYELSEGEKKRVAIATILSYDPDFILLDEPTANMDGRGRREFKNLLKNLIDEDKTIVIATHLLRDITYATRIIGLLKGKIYYDDDPSILEEEKYLKKLNII